MLVIQRLALMMAALISPAMQQPEIWSLLS